MCAFISGATNKKFFLLSVIYSGAHPMAGGGGGIRGRRQMARLFPKTQVLRPKMDYLVRPHLILFLIFFSLNLLIIILYQI